MKLNLKRTVAALAGLAAAASIVPIIAAPAAYAAPTNSGPATLSPLSSNDSSQPFTVTPTADAACPGDGGDGWRVTSYLVPATVDPATLSFNTTQGPVPSAFGSPQSAFRQPLSDTTGEPYIVAQPANKDPNAADPNAGNIINVPAFSFGVYGPGDVPAGEYNIGIACVMASGTSFPIDKFWNNTITVTTNAADPGTADISWSQGASAPAPTITGVAIGSGQLAISFTGSGADNWTAQASTVAGDFSSSNLVGSSTTATSSGTVTVSGLANGTTYYVRVLANKAGFAATPSAQSGPHSPSAGAQPAVGNLASDGGAAGSTAVSLTWTAPAGGLTPTGYAVAIDPSGGTVTVSGTTAQITGLTSGSSYTCTVTPTYADPSATATPASTACIPTATGVTILQQNVTVTRPAGALVFTQKCEQNADGTPLAGAPFGNAPCAIAFGTAVRVIPGGGVTPYLSATASLNNVQVDNWGDDNGWTVTGDMSEFVSGDPASAAPNKRFSGDQLGWTPETVSTTGGLVVALGAAVAPGTAGGMSASPTLASSEPGFSLGIAEFDADLAVKIPMSKGAGLYSGTLTMTATPG